MQEIPEYALRAYALFYTRHGTKDSFTQAELGWVVQASMRKKIFATLVRAGWINKVSRIRYHCASPENIFKRLLDFRVPDAIKTAKRPYAFTNLSAVEIWSDYSYVLRGVDRSPYFIKILKNDITYWKRFFKSFQIPVYVGEGSTVGEFVILIPVNSIESVEKEHFFVEPLKTAMTIARKNDMYAYPYEYMRRKYGSS